MIFRRLPFLRDRGEWSRPFPVNWRPILACLLGGVCLWPLVNLLPMVGWDWFYWFVVPGKIPFYPPWTAGILWPLTRLPWRAGLALLNSLTLMAVAVATVGSDPQQNLRSRMGAGALALLTPPVFMNLWLGNVEGLALIGLLAFPPGVLLALIKPNLTIWAALARRASFIWVLAIGLVSILIWGFWPLQMIAELERLTANSMAIGWANLGWPVAVLGAGLLIFSRPDPYQLMSAGFLLSPYLMPNHSLVLLPALGKVHGWPRLALWVAAWVSALAAGFPAGPFRLLGLLFPLAVWVSLRK